MWYQGVENIDMSDIYGKDNKNKTKYDITNLEVKKKVIKDKKTLRKNPEGFLCFIINSKVLQFLKLQSVILHHLIYYS